MPGVASNGISPASAANNNFNQNNMNNVMDIQGGEYSSDFALPSLGK
jgi:hypothetical protein